MDAIISKSELDGKATPPPPKSYSHRAFIAASLSTKCKIYNFLISDDALATLALVFLPSNRWFLAIGFDWDYVHRL
ncbi:MAG: hypothetical protein H0Z28_06455 [Archaeoglobus sp.]|nr:hypothetical protein [Archaeoglobus sp.]